MTAVPFRIERRQSFVVKTNREIDVEMSSEEEEEETEYRKGGKQTYVNLL